jgi:hypothetical protein
MKSRHTDDEFIKIVEDSASIAQVLKRLGLAPVGGNYRTAHNRIRRLNLSTSHFSGSGWSRGKKIGPYRPIDHYTSNAFPIGSCRLKKRLIDAGLKPAICETCLNTEWGGSAIPLELHHIDGDHRNNSLSNLKLLCPNCHALTENYRGKNQERSSTKRNRGQT